MTVWHLLLFFIADAVCREWPSDLRLPASHAINHCIAIPPLTDSHPDRTIHTQLIPYTPIGASGYIYGFQFCSGIANKFVRLEILRNEACPSGSCYRLLGHVSVSNTVIGANYAYLERPLAVSFNDVLGMTYSGRNPVAYSTFSGCAHSADHLIRYNGFANTNDLLTFSNTYEFVCKRFALQVFLEAIDNSNDCEIHQAIDDEVPYSLFSHDGYPQTNYQSNYYRCWKVRAAERNHVIVFDVVYFDVEFHSSCVFDKISFHDPAEPQPPASCYHDNCLAYCGYYENKQWILNMDRVLLTFSTDAQVTRDGFYLQFRSVDPALYPHINALDYEIDWSNDDETSTVPANTPESGQSSSNKDQFWKDWEDWQRAVLVIGIIVGVALLALFIVLLLFYFCDRGGDKAVTSKQSGKVAVNEPCTIPNEKARHSSKLKSPRFSNVYATEEPIVKEELPPLYSESPDLYQYIQDLKATSTVTRAESDDTSYDDPIWYSNLQHSENDSPRYGTGSYRSYSISKSSSVATKTIVMPAPKQLKSNKTFGHRYNSNT